MRVLLAGIVEGQIYIPEANWALMCLTIIVVAGFRDPLAISNAYGAQPPSLPRPFHLALFLQRTLTLAGLM
jgi:hypothetical protein